MEKVIIIGSGPAGSTAAIYLARANLSPLVLEGIQPGGQLTTTTDVENYPGFVDPIDGTELVDRMKQQAQRFGARYMPANAKSTDFSGRPLKVVLDDGAALEATSVIIATGASARYLGLESEQKLLGHGVSACATCDGPLYRNVPLVVIGGGDTAMEESLFLTRFASKVTILHRRDQFRASKIMFDRASAHPKIEIVRNAVVEEVLDAARGEVTGVRTRDVVSGAKRVIPAGGMFVAIGHSPNTAAFAGQVAMNENGYVIASLRMRTNVDGVFAAGDVHDPTYRQGVSAAGFGCMAALEAERYLESQGH